MVNRSRRRTRHTYISQQQNKNTDSATWHVHGSLAGKWEISSRRTRHRDSATWHVQGSLAGKWEISSRRARHRDSATWHVQGSLAGKWEISSRRARHRDSAIWHVQESLAGKWSMSGKRTSHRDSAYQRGSHGGRWYLHDDRLRGRAHLYLCSASSCCVEYSCVWVELAQYVLSEVCYVPHTRDLYL